MERHAPRSKEYILFRDCFIIFLIKDKGLSRADVMEELGISKFTIDSRLKKYEDPVAAAEHLENARTAIRQKRNLVEFVNQFAERRNHCTDAKKM